ncbi:hypothetical protein JL193_01500 [Polaribacter batillariae]|uniref:Yip1 domain-containing protein n=1 Tax=Polaribacter batillariae TaxID=2808900 RepID=A0ABX7SYV0_9FLAO|nr:hypothetical protein [Polaribacter batillariae]QTD38008.1 hypothetical protein JL193_01500 [Polaribacter batillariae]
MIKKNILLFLILSILTLFLSFLLKYFLEINELISISLAEQFSKEQLQEVTSYNNKAEKLIYIFTPLFLFVKVSIIAAIIDAGCFFFGKEIKYKKLFTIVVKAEFIFLLVIVFKIVWFCFFQINYTLQDLQYFYPLSALNIVGYQGLESWFIYPFQVLNLFEVAYWFILAYLIGKEINDTTDKGFLIVASSYGVGLLIWVVGAMFLTLNMS